MESAGTAAGGAGALAGTSYLLGANAGKNKTVDRVSETIGDASVGDRLRLAHGMLFNPDGVANQVRTTKSAFFNNDTPAPEKGLWDTVNQYADSGLEAAGEGMASFGDHIKKNPDLYKVLALALGTGYLGHRLGKGKGSRY